MQSSRRLPLGGFAGTAASSRPHRGVPTLSLPSSPSVISLWFVSLLALPSLSDALGIESRHGELNPTHDDKYSDDATGLAGVLSWTQPVPNADVEDHKPMMRWEGREPGASSYAQQSEQESSGWYNFGDEDQAGEPNASALSPLKKNNVSGLIFTNPQATKYETFHEPPARIILYNPEAHSGVAPEALYLIIAFVTILFYFVHSKTETLRKTTWEGLTQGLSIFLALTLFYMIKDLTDLAVETEEAVVGTSSSSTASESNVSLAFGRMSMMLIFVEVGLYVVRKKDSPTMVLMLVGAHIVGFFSADAFGSMQETSPWNGSTAMSGAITGLTLVFWWVIIRLMSWIRYKATHVEAEEGDSESEYAAAVWADWEARVENAENEAAAFAIGLVLTQTVRFAITGKAEPIHGVQKNPHSSEINKLLFFGLASGLLICFFKFLSRKFGHYSDKLRRALDLLCSSSAYTMAWSLLYWGRWRFWFATMDKGLVGGGDVMTAQIVMAMFFSTVLTLIILGLFRLRSSMATPAYVELVTILITALNVLIGLAWQTCFLTANTEVVGRLLEESHHKRYGRACIGSFLCAMVAPAWFFYILPNSYFCEKELALSEERQKKFLEQAKAGPEGEAAEEPTPGDAPPPAAST